MRMRINTLGKRRIIHCSLFFLFFLKFSILSFGQCPSASSPQTFCDIQFFPSAPRVSNLVATNNGGGVAWFSSPTSTVPLSPSSGLVSGQTYFLDNSTGNCGSRVAVAVTIFGRPDAQSFQGPCVDVSSAATVSMLQATGNNVQWYLTPSGGAPLLPTDVLIDNGFYYCSQTNPFTGCETSRRVVQANVGLVPVPTGNSIQVFCNDLLDPPTLEDVVASGNNNWYATASSVIPLSPSTPLVDGQSFFATTVDLPCESAARLEVQVQLVEPANAGISAERRICVNELSTFPPFNLFDELFGTPDNTGTWSGPLTTTGGNLGTVDVSSLTLSGSPYIFTYTVSTAPCPNVESTVTIIVLPLPTASISSANPNVCFGGNGVVNFSGTPGATVTYSTGGGPNQTVTLDGSGSFVLNTPSLTVDTTYTLVSVSSSGVPSCTTSVAGSTSFTIVPLPSVTIASSPVCAGSTATVTATPGALGSYSYAWTVPSGATNPGNVSTFTTTVPGVYSLIMTNLTTSCASNPVTVNVVVNPLPTASVTIVNSPICPGQSATITAVPGTPESYSYAWTVPSGVSPPGNVASFSATIAGTYSVVLTNTVTNCVSPSFSETLAVSPLPTVSVSAPPVCAGTAATVTATPGTPGSYSYVWTVPTGATDPGNVASFSTSVIGIYSVIITNTVTSCASASGSATVVVDPIPTVAVTSSPVCVGANATVTATPSLPGNYLYVWTVPSGATNPGNVASFSTAVPGTYSVVATTTTTNCASASTSTTVVVNPLPTVNVTLVNETICPGESAVVTALPVLVGTYDFAWTVPTGVPAPGNVSTFTATIAGVYSVIITNTVTTCASTPASATLIVSPLPTVTAASPPVCQGDTALVTATPGTPGNYNYVWIVPSGAVNPGNVDSFSTSVPGTYSVTLTDTVTNCQSTSASTTVTINPIPAVAATSAPVCSGVDATVTATPSVPGNYTYVWTVPSGATNPGSTNTFTTAVSGNYSVTITDTVTNCPSVSADVTVVINATPTVTVTSSSICATGIATVTATAGVPGNYSYVWTVPAGVTDPGNVDSFTTATAGTYSVQVTDLITGCVSTTSGSVTINPLPTVTVNSPSVCPGVDATIIATPANPGTYSYSWTVPAGATNPGNVSTFSTSVLGTYSVIVTDLVTTCQSLTASGVVIASPIPTVTVNDTSICSGNTATVIATPDSGSPADYSYVWTVPSGVANPGNVSSFDTSTAGIYGVVVTNIATTCVSVIDFGTVVINPTPTVTVNSASICAGSNATITAAPSVPGTYNYSWSVPSGATDPGNVVSFVTSLAGSYSVTITDTTTNCPSTSATGTVTINPLPTAAVSSSGTVCSESSAIILFTGTPNSIVTYNINNGASTNINIGPTGLANLTISLSETSTFNLVSVTLANPPSCSQLLTGSTTVNVTQPPVAGSNAAISFCSNGTVQDLFTLLGASAQAGGTWSPTLASGTGVFDPAVDLAGNYIYTVAGTPPCVNDTALVTVTFIPQANAGVDASPNLCSNSDPIDLVSFLGSAAQSGGTWSPSLISGSGVFDPGTDAAGVYTYTVAGVFPCGDDTATVNVSITPGPNAGTSGSTTLCVNSPASDLFLSLGGNPQVGGTWSPTLASGTGVFDPAVDAPGVYTYTFSGNQPCDDDTATVTVTVNPLPDAGDDANASICSNISSVDLITFLGGFPQTGGTWSPALASGIGVFNPAVDLPGTYTYTVGALFCTPDISTLVVTVVPGPEAGNSGAVTFCVTSPPQDLFLSLGGSPQTGGEWTPALASLTGVFDPAVDAPGVYTYTLSGSQPCDNDSATVTVTVDPVPNAGSFVGNQDACSSQGTFDLFSLLTGFQSGGLWTDATDQTVTSTIDISTFSPGVYIFTYKVENSCLPADTETVQFTVLPNPVLTSSNIQVSSPNCTGENVVVTFANMIDGSYSLDYNLTLSNVALNQNATVEIIGGTGTLTLDAGLIPLAGTTRITFLNITNNNTSCTTAINPNVSADFIILPSSNIEDEDLSISSVCLRSEVVVTLLGSFAGNEIQDGLYQFGYTIPNANPETGISDAVQVIKGSGSFTLSGTIFSNPGIYSLTINSIISLSGNCNNLSEDASTDFEIYAIPNLSNGLLLSQDNCINQSNPVTITGEGGANLTSGSYEITYELSGATSATITDIVEIIDNQGVFTIPGSDLDTVGTVTLTITQIQSVVGNCLATAIGIDPISFEVEEIETPILLPKGNEFCVSDNPTIASLSSNVGGTQTVVWYDAPNGGTAYVSTDLLVNETTYYAAYVSTGGCESTTRLAVTVDLTRCEDILVPDGFSPNGDNVNDSFVIKDIEIAYPNFTLEIYNRYGNILYKGNINTPNWDGTTSEGGLKFGNGAVPVGVYFYILNFNDGERDPKQGRLYLSR